MNDKKENDRSKAFSDEKQDPPINTPQSASHKSDEKHTGKEVEQIAFPANPFWYDKYGEFFSSSWCPLYGEIPESFKADNLTKQCVRIIEESRNIWQCFPQPDISKYSEWKLKLAQGIWKLFCAHFETRFQSQDYRGDLVDLEWERVTTWTRQNPILELKELTDFEIVALFAVYVTWRALEDWLTIEKGESLACLHPPFDEYSFVKEKMHIALLVLSQAKKMADQTQKETVNKITSSPTPFGAKRSELKILSLFYDDAKGILFLEDGKHCELTGDEQTLFNYLKKSDEHVDGIIKHFCNEKEYSNTNWGRGNFDPLKTNLNKKFRSAFGVELIKNLEKGSGEYGISVKVKDRKFKK